MDPSELGEVPITVVMITLNEAHALDGALSHLRGWAARVVIVDSYSSDATIDVALEHGATVVQRRFRSFGDQWNFAISQLPIDTPWTMKLDPDERVSDELKESIRAAILCDNADGLTVTLRLWFMGRALPVRQQLLRVWRTGTCRFSDVAVNEHPIVRGRVVRVSGDLEHHDSPSLEHWYEKQNRYTTAEAAAAFRNEPLSAQPRLLGDRLERRMWLKRHWRKLPLRYQAMFLANYFGKGAWKAGRAGLVWARLRADVYRMIEDKLLEMQLAGSEPAPLARPGGRPDPRVPQY